MVLKFKDKFNILIISCMLTAKIEETGKKDKSGVSVQKASDIIDYNKYMGVLTELLS